MRIDGSLDWIRRREKLKFISKSIWKILSPVFAVRYVDKKLYNRKWCVPHVNMTSRYTNKIHTFQANNINVWQHALICRICLFSLHYRTELALFLLCLQKMQGDHCQIYYRPWFEHRVFYICLCKNEI